jgi:hypothetical protein
MGGGDAFEGRGMNSIIHWVLTSALSKCIIGSRNGP